MLQTAIKAVHARQVMDCKFRPVVEVDVTLNNGIFGRGAAPTGTSVGVHEAKVLRDNNEKCFRGLSVFNAIDNVNNIIAPAIVGMDIKDQEAIDRRMLELDGTADKSRLGGNAIYSVSQACMRARAEALNLSVYEATAEGPLTHFPLPTANSIIGGKYQDMLVPFQEFTFCPYKAASISEAMEIIFHVHHMIGEVFAEQLPPGTPAETGNALGWKPPVEDPLAIMEMLDEAVRRCGYQEKVAYALDCAASEVYDEATDTYYMNGKRISTDEQISYLKGLTEKFNFLFMEDVLQQNDWAGFAKASAILDKTLVIGDDLTVSNRKLLEKAYKEHAAEGFIFKPNQVGTITEAIESRRFAKEHGMLTIPSQRGGGTIWDSVIDLGVGLEAEACKSCAPRGGESVYAMNCIYRASQEYPDVPMFDFSSYVRF